MLKRTPAQVLISTQSAFGRGDVTAIVNLVASEVDWEGIVPATLPYAGRRPTPQEVADFFAAIARVYRFESFEPREFRRSRGTRHSSRLGKEGGSRDRENAGERMGPSVSR